MRLSAILPAHRAEHRPGLPARTVGVGLVVAVAATVAFSVAAWPAAAGEAVEDTRPEKKEEPLPPFPQAENLFFFNDTATTENQFMIDGNSLTVSSDGVVRFSLVIVSSAGARNVSYEAINCLTAERRLYALGRSDNTWARARNDQWLKIRDNTLNRQYAALYTEYFCPTASVLRDADEAREALRRGGHPSLRLH